MTTTSSSPEGTIRASKSRCSPPIVSRYSTVWTPFEAGTASAAPNRSATSGGSTSRTVRAEQLLGRARPCGPGRPSPPGRCRRGRSGTSGRGSRRAAPGCGPRCAAAPGGRGPSRSRAARRRRPRRAGPAGAGAPRRGRARPAGARPTRGRSRRHPAGRVGLELDRVPAGVDVAVDLVEPGQELQRRVAEDGAQPLLRLLRRGLVGHLPEQTRGRPVEPVAQQAGEEEERDGAEGDERDDPEDVPAPVGEGARRRTARRRGPRRSRRRGRPARGCAAAPGSRAASAGSAGRSPEEDHAADDREERLERVGDRLAVVDHVRVVGAVLAVGRVPREERGQDVRRGSRSPRPAITVLRSSLVASRPSGNASIRWTNAARNRLPAKAPSP